MQLSTLVLIVANLVPLAGVVFWGWDVFVLLILYWLETAVIGFWTIVRIALVPAQPPTLARMSGQGGRAFGRFGIALFLTVHAGIFMTVHFLFLWTLFAGAWADIVRGPVGFVRFLVIGTGLWLPLLVLFLVRGWFVFRAFVLGELEQDGDVLAGLYTRIVVMQVAIILGGWVAQITGGSIATLVLLVIGKTLVEVYAGGLSAKSDEATAAAAGERDKAG